jgi:hypothetical protein
VKFAHQYVDLSFLQHWLDKREWPEAWLEGNNLLFVGQFLVHLRDVEGIRGAQLALNLYFEWLNGKQDPKTGLWGSNGYCSIPKALYGGYHQLLLYYHEDRSVNYPERLIDSALSLQNEDGGFNPGGGGGACEDVDAIDILANMYKQVDYRRAEIRYALRKALQHILMRQMPDGGFVYRLNEPFIHMGIKRTASEANRSNLFPTWFRVHALALISEILTDEPIAQFDWRFNNSVSMGWHRKWKRDEHMLTFFDRVDELFNLSRKKLLNRSIYISLAKRLLPNPLKYHIKRSILRRKDL